MKGAGHTTTLSSSASLTTESVQLYRARNGAGACTLVAIEDCVTNPRRRELEEQTDLLEPWALEKALGRFELVNAMELLALARGEGRLAAFLAGVGHVFNGLLDNCHPKTAARFVISVFAVERSHDRYGLLCSKYRGVVCHRASQRLAVASFYQRGSRCLAGAGPELSRMAVR